MQFYFLNYTNKRNIILPDIEVLQYPGKQYLLPQYPGNSNNTAVINDYFYLNFRNTWFWRYKFNFTASLYIIGTAARFHIHNNSRNFNEQRFLKECCFSCTWRNHFYPTRGRTQTLPHEHRSKVLKIFSSMFMPSLMLVASTLQAKHLIVKFLDSRIWDRINY